MRQLQFTIYDSLNEPPPRGSNYNRRYLVEARSVMRGVISSAPIATGQSDQPLVAFLDAAWEAWEIVKDQVVQERNRG